MTALDLDYLERVAREDLTGDYPWPQVLALISRLRAAEAALSAAHERMRKMAEALEPFATEALLHDSKGSCEAIDPLFAV